METSAFAYLEILLARERYEFDYVPLIANLLELVPVRDDEEYQIFRRLAIKTTAFVGETKMTEDPDGELNLDPDLVEAVKRETSPPKENNEKDSKNVGVHDEPFYPSVTEIIEIHSDIIEDDPNAEPGLKHRGDLEYAIDHIEHGHFGEGPETLHEKAYQLMRLIAANHPFVDGNKRTALASTVYFYFWNGYELEYQEELEAMLVLVSIREDFIDPGVAAEHLEDIAKEFEIEHILNFFESLDLLTEVAENMENGFGREDNWSP